MISIPKQRLLIQVATECRDAKYLTAAGSCEYLCPEGTYPSGAGEWADWMVDGCQKFTGPHCVLGHLGGVSLFLEAFSKESWLVRSETLVTPSPVFF